LPPAVDGFTAFKERIEPRPTDMLLPVAGAALGDLHTAQPDVALAKARQRIGRQTSAAPAPDLVVVALDIRTPWLWPLVMGASCPLT
jgi:hypothetical protein